MRSVLMVFLLLGLSFIATACATKVEYVDSSGMVHVTTEKMAHMLLQRDMHREREKSIRSAFEHA